MRPLTLAIEGMSCHHCLNSVNKALAQIPGVGIQSVRIGRAELTYDESLVTPEVIATAVTASGYRATPAVQ